MHNDIVGDVIKHGGRWHTVEGKYFQHVRVTCMEEKSLKVSLGDYESIVKNIQDIESLTDETLCQECTSHNITTINEDY